ncbi:MAG: hypothetical protein DHS20C17_21900 [Cyclobacteriaceae bacterium]|nr:MAG: hypothetical protein DHS20C17_21900 [Cyclobacteriaceae bacterium]
MSFIQVKRTRAQESRAAIERLYIVMKHLFIRGYYKPFGVSGTSIREALLVLSPEIYGSINDTDKVELEGLIYVMERLPKGIEECRFIKLTSEEGYGNSSFEVIIPAKRRRNCYRIDDEQMFIEITRGRSEIYDLLTHLTFLYIEAEKIKNRALDEKGRKTREWVKMEKIVEGGLTITNKNRELAFSYLSIILGRTFGETERIYERFEGSENYHGLFHVVYWLGKLALQESADDKDRSISFTATLRERIGHHIYGDRWAARIKEYLLNNDLMGRPIHVISSNLHSVLNSLYAFAAIGNMPGGWKGIEKTALELSKLKNAPLNQKVQAYAEKHGVKFLEDPSGTNISVQIMDLAKLDIDRLPEELMVDKEYIQQSKPVILMMDYAFGEQAYEVMDELLRPVESDKETILMPIHTISVMGKAGILTGNKGDIMIPTAHVFEGTADNYPIENQLTAQQFKGYGLEVFEGPMITVLGTSLQNRDILNYFKSSSWRCIGLEMEGAHFQKAIQAASKIRKNIDREVELRYAYYASDNPLISGSTLASGSLGAVGVKPTYLITLKILGQILRSN